LPPPTGRYNVGVRKYRLSHTTENDPFAPNNVSSSILLTFYYPTQARSRGPIPALEKPLADIFEEGFVFAPGTLANITSNFIYDAPFLPESAGTAENPTIFFGPGGGGPPTPVYQTSLGELASHWYNVIGIDHPYEQQYIKYPDGEEVFGIPITYDLLPVVNQMYAFRLTDTTAVLDALPAIVQELGAAFNTTHFAGYGHSLGGAAAVGSAQIDERIVGAINMDGSFWGDLASTNETLADVKKPSFLLGFEFHMSAVDATWSSFPHAQSGWWREFLVQGSLHWDFSDGTFWKELGPHRSRSLGPINGERMVKIVRAFVTAFFDKLIGDAEPLLENPGRKWPEV
ncbi:hypothetical protein M501DRAFT_920955, partial [Patellaria atrata CBS 101060]